MIFLGFCWDLCFFADDRGIPPRPRLPQGLVLTLPMRGCSSGATGAEGDALEPGALVSSEF